MKVRYLWLVVVLLVGLFTGCDTKEQSVSDANIMQDGKGLYTIVRGQDASDAVINSVVELNKAIAQKTGVSLAVSTDRDEANDESCEILIGKTNRPESKAVLKTLSENSYAVAIRNNKVVIIGTDDHMLILGLHEFYNRVLKSEKQTGKGYILMSADSVFAGTVEESFSLSDMITLGGTIQTSCVNRFALTLPNDDQQKNYHIAQGAASDGVYGYFAQRNADDTGTVIAKYRMEDAQLVATSEVLALGHANGMAYDPERKCLLVVDGLNKTNALWMIDPETLTITEEIKLPKTAHGIAVHPKTGEYVIHTRYDFWVLDKDFALKSSYARKKVDSAYGTQSVWADESYIYFPMSGKKSKGKKDCILEVYDWDGHYVTRVTIPVAEEIEAMFMANNRYYASFNIIAGAQDEVYELFDFAFSYFKVK